MVFQRRNRGGAGARGAEEPLDDAGGEVATGRDPADSEAGAPAAAGRPEPDTAATGAAAAGPDDARPPEATDGPYDLADAPDDGLERVDFGALRLPVRPDVEMRIELSPDQQVVAVTLLHAGSAMQVSAFAAPRRAGIWEEVREEIAAALREQKLTVAEVDGPFGPELRGVVLAPPAPDAAPVPVPARFIGVDGPRWFMRALVNGPAAQDPASAPVFDEVVRDTVVVRGSDAMAPRDPLVLRLPREMLEAARQAGVVAPERPDPGRFADLDPNRRGPEVTEVR